MNNLRLDLWKEKQRIKVQAVINLREIPDGAFSFYLGSGYTIQSMTDGFGQLVEYVQEEQVTGWAPYWADRDKYTINDIPSTLNVLYTGITEAQHTMLTDDILSINGSGFWYPCGLPFQPQSWNREVFIHVGKEYIVLNACFNDDEDAWYYQPQENELFILALKNFHSKTSRGGTIYYFIEKDDEKAEICVNSVEMQLSYFERLYGYKTIDHMPIVSLPVEFNAGAYNIDRTIILNRFVFDYDDDALIRYEKLVHMMGHEIAHNWCCGAAFDWEDWLNETTAEWSSLAFLIENGYEDYVDEVIKTYCEVETPEPIRTPSGKKPDQVHIKGTILFYSIFQKYGLGAIKDLLQTFVTLGEKNTKTWIQALKKNHPRIVSEILAHLDAEMLNCIELADDS